MILNKYCSMHGRPLSKLESAYSRQELVRHDQTSNVNSRQDRRGQARVRTGESYMSRPAFEDPVTPGPFNAYRTYYERMQIGQ